MLDKTENGPVVHRNQITSQIAFMGCRCFGARIGVGQDRFRSCRAPKSHHLTDRSNRLSVFSVRESVLDKTVSGPVVHRNPSISRIASHDSPVSSVQDSVIDRTGTMSMQHAMTVGSLLTRATVVDFRTLYKLFGEYPRNRLRFRGSTMTERQCFLLVFSATT